MVTPNPCFKKYGEPKPDNRWLTMWNVPPSLRFGPVPKRIFCNADLVSPLATALRNIIDRGLQDELETWDGVFNIRKIRGSDQNWSLHSWAIAVDVNAAKNPLGATPVMSAEFVKCWTDAGFDWGGNFTRKDGMHFQLAKI